VEQRPHTCVESMCNTLKILERDIALASFDGADVRPMKQTTFAKFFLAQAEREPLRSNDMAQVFLEKRFAHVGMHRIQQE